MRLIILTIILGQLRPQLAVPEPLANQQEFWTQMNNVTNRYGPITRNGIEMMAVLEDIVGNMDLLDNRPVGMDAVESELIDRMAFAFFTSSFDRIFQAVGMGNFYDSMRTGISTGATCLACHAITILLASPLATRDMLAMAGRRVCRMYDQTPDVCDGLVTKFKIEMDFVRRHTRLTPNEVCGVLLGYKCAYVVTNNLAWTVDIPARPAIRNRFADVDLNDQSADIKFLQFTDIHFDPLYHPGSVIDCGKPLCCRESVGHAPNGSNRSAGEWGSYQHCDLPIVTLNNALKHMAKTHRVDYYLWTGDAVPHDIWRNTRSNNIEICRIITEYIKRHVPEGVPVVPVVGNHEGIPINSFPPPNITDPQFSNEWLYTGLADQWSQWLPDDEKPTFIYGGFYTLLIKPGLRLIVLNTNYCARLNVWSAYDPRDPAGQLQWLAGELAKAEAAVERVHLIGHVPPDNRECTQAWLMNFIRILTRFQDTVEAQFYGHTHADEFRIHYDLKNQKHPVGFAFVAPSLTTYHQYNPGYRVYQSNRYGRILDFKNYFFNLTHANAGNWRHKPDWQFEYSARDSYKMDNLTRFGWADLAGRLAKDDQLFDTYKEMYYRHSDWRSKMQCDKKCRGQMIDDLNVNHPFNEKPKPILGID